jgi:hypothetical protein
LTGSPGQAGDDGEETGMTCGVDFGLPGYVKFVIPDLIRYPEVLVITIFSWIPAFAGMTTKAASGFCI